MRVGVNLLFLLPGVVGGTETYAVSLVEALARIDGQTEYFVFTNRESASLSLPASDRVRRVPCRVSAMSRVSRYSWEQLVLPTKVRPLHLEVLHSLGYVQPLRLPCRSVVTIHDSTAKRSFHREAREDREENSKPRIFFQDNLRESLTFSKRF